MNTQKAIEFLNECQDENIELQEEGHNKLLLEVIDLLKRGEKYEAILEEMKEIYCNGKRVTHIVFNNLIQKYFPKSGISESEKEDKLEKRVIKLERENVFFSNEQYGDITQEQIIREILNKLGLRIETSHIPAKEDIKEFKLVGGL